MAQELLIETIRTDAALQSRVQLNDETITDYSELIKSGKRLPPVDVYNDGSDNWMADGFHRLRAHEEAGKRNIKANVHKGTRADALWHSCGANKDHGLRRSNADKAKATRMAIEARPESSVELISLHCGVSDVFARQLKTQVVNALPPEHRPKVVLGKDGKTYKVTPTPPLRPKTPPPPPLPSARKVPPPPTAAKTIPPPPPERPTSPDAGCPHDDVGKLIPDHLAPSWVRATNTIKVWLSALREVKRDVHADADAGGHVVFDCNHQQIEAALETVITALKANVPYAVCPYCHGGAMQAGCRFCLGKGITGKHKYDYAASSEVK